MWLIDGKHILIGGGANSWWGKGKVFVVRYVMGNMPIFDDNTNVHPTCVRLCDGKGMVAWCCFAILWMLLKQKIILTIRQLVDDLIWLMDGWYVGWGRERCWLKIERCCVMDGEDIDWWIGRMLNDGKKTHWLTDGIVNCTVVARENFILLIWWKLISWGWS